MSLFTFGHGRASEDELVNLVREAGLTQVIDVRSVPKSRAHPHVWRERMEVWIPMRCEATYHWEPRLGGFRRARSDSLNRALRHASFRGYADYMQTTEFLKALDELMGAARNARTAIVCSESLWWRCHRRLIADAATLLHGSEVRHVMHAGPAVPHRLTQGVRRLPEGGIQYDLVADDGANGEKGGITLA